jgi:hypothetical protein
VLAPATLAALPSTRAIPDRDVFYVAHPARSIVSRSLPLGSTATFAALPAMSLIPFAPFSAKHGYPPDLQDEATKLVLQQAELLCAEWAA